MIDEGRAEWETPELIVLARSRPEEAVLLVCKHRSAVAPQAQSPIYKYDGCTNRRIQVCELCQLSTMS
jgi:hypothetical protein